MFIYSVWHLLEAHWQPLEYEGGVLYTLVCQAVVSWSVRFLHMRLDNLLLEVPA